MSAETPFKPGDRVYVIDEGLAQLRRRMRQFGETPAPNHHGTVSDEEWDEPGTVLINFDDGGGAPYEVERVRLLIEGDADALV